MKILSFLCTKWMENCEAMTSSPHSFAYSYRLFKKCFLKICETSKCHNFLIFQPIFIRFSLLCLKFFTLSSEIKLNLLWSSSLRGCGERVNCTMCEWFFFSSAVSTGASGTNEWLNYGLFSMWSVHFINNNLNIMML